MTNISLSLIIATYQSGNCLADCLQSVSNLMLPEHMTLEVIIIDGGSTDETMSIVNSFSNVVSKSISEKDSGIYDAWNKGIKVSTGDWIMFIGSDDTLLPNALAIYGKCIDKNKNVDYISSKVNLVDFEGNFLQTVGNRFSWLKFKRYMTVAHVGSIHNRKLYDEIGLYNLDYKICGDYELLLRKGSELNTIFINEVTANMRIGGISYSSIDALVETRYAKLTHNVVGKLVAWHDYYWAVLKMYVRRYVEGISNAK